MKKLSLLLFILLLPLVAMAAAVEINGIYYNLNTEDMVAAVAPKSGFYSGAISIPETVTYEDIEYCVTSIGYQAFYNCSGLTSISIPNTVTSIDDSAFLGCI